MYERINPEFEALKGVSNPDEALKGIKIRVCVRSNEPIKNDDMTKKVKVTVVYEGTIPEDVTEEQREMLTEQIWQISRSYATDPLLILSVVAQESHGNPNARGRMQSGAYSGALGLMQIKLETAKKMSAHFGLQIETEEDLLKPEINVTVGTAYLIRLISKYGNWKDALIAYNLGHSAVDRMLESGKPLPTKYYEHVISKYRKLTGIDFLGTSSP